MDENELEERILLLEGYVQALRDLITAFIEAYPVKSEPLVLLQQYADALHESADVREDIYDYVQVSIDFGNGHDGELQ